MFQFTKEELENWRSQIVTSNPTAKMGLRRPPYAFTEHGVAMLSSVLTSDRAVQMNIVIIRAFLKLREMLATNKDLAARVGKLEANQNQHASVINILADEIDALKQLPPEPPRNPIGFVDRNSDEGIQQLQIYLNTNGFSVAVSRAGSSGHETTRFGRLTQIALINFQKAHHITPAAGYFGSISRNAVASFQ